jgi:hypothetical protein
MMNPINKDIHNGWMIHILTIKVCMANQRKIKILTNLSFIFKIMISKVKIWEIEIVYMVMQINMATDLQKHL